MKEYFIELLKKLSMEFNSVYKSDEIKFILESQEELFKMMATKNQLEGDIEDEITELIYYYNFEEKELFKKLTGLNLKDFNDKNLNLKEYEKLNELIKYFPEKVLSIEEKVHYGIMILIEYYRKLNNCNNLIKSFQK